MTLKNPVRKKKRLKRVQIWMMIGRKGDGRERERLDFQAN